MRKKSVVWAASAGEGGAWAYSLKWFSAALQILVRFLRVGPSKPSKESGEEVETTSKWEFDGEK